MSLALYIGPGNKDYREKLAQYMLKNESLFKQSKKHIGEKWLRLYKKEFLQKNDFESAEIEEMRDKISSKWADFVKTDLEEINSYVREFKLL